MTVNLVTGNKHGLIFLGADLLRPIDETHVRAELQPLDTDPQRSTVALQKVFEERFQTSRAADALVDFFDLSTRQFSPSRANRSRFPQAIEKNLDFAQCKTHIPREADKEYPVKEVVSMGRRNTFLKFTRRSLET